MGCSRPVRNRTDGHATRYRDQLNQPVVDTTDPQGAQLGGFLCTRRRGGVGVAKAEDGKEQAGKRRGDGAQPPPLAVGQVSGLHAGELGGQAEARRGHEGDPPHRASLQPTHVRDVPVVDEVAPQEDEGERPRGQHVRQPREHPSLQPVARGPWLIARLSCVTSIRRRRLLQPAALEGLRVKNQGDDFHVLERYRHAADHNSRDCRGGEKFGERTADSRDARGFSGTGRRMHGGHRVRHCGAWCRGQSRSCTARRPRWQRRGRRRGVDRRRDGPSRVI
mmetsp:Transcript_9214/g.22919  ORF Transcript_9214/g.22919 Transcript_9214/m.22919 type:complete len:278 (+) Transcript_9214:380-1213(+)